MGNAPTCVRTYHLTTMWCCKSLMSLIITVAVIQNSNKQ